MSNLAVLEECLKDMSDDDVKNIAIRFSQKVGNDISEAVSILESKEELVTFFETNSSSEYFELLDRADEIIQNEFKIRSIKKTTK